MYRKPALITTILCCAALSVAAQDKATLAAAKVKLMKQAINFYSNDTMLSATPVSCDATDMRSLRDCAKKLPKVEAKIDKWDAMPLATAEDLRALSRTIKSDVVANREYRKSYTQYPIFLKNINSIVAGVPAARVDSTPVQPVATEPLAATSTDSAAAQNPPPATVSAQPPVVVADTTVRENKVSESGLPEGLNVWNIAAIVLSLLALIKSFIPKKQREIYRAERDIVAAPAPVKDNSDVMNAKLGAVISEVEELNRMVLEIDARVQRRLDDMKHGNTGA